MLSGHNSSDGDGLVGLGTSGGGVEGHGLVWKEIVYEVGSGHGVGEVGG